MDISVLRLLSSTYSNTLIFIECAGVMLLSGEILIVIHENTDHSDSMQPSRIHIHARRKTTS